VRLEPEEYMIMHQNTETYTMLYGILISIGRSHVLLTEHSMNLQIVQNIMLAALNIFGHNANASSPDLINMFYGILCYCMHLCQLGLKSYRKDILGEDIRKRCPLAYCCCCQKKCPVELIIFVFSPPHMLYHTVPGGAVGASTKRWTPRHRSSKASTARTLCKP